jgi:dTDP-4-amino-4,6-dideoxygalactose transaminase
MRVPFVDLAAQEETAAADVLAAIAEVGRDARFILGPRVEAFERWLAESCGVAHAVGVASGSDALELSLRALGIGGGDAVVTPALSFVAAAEAIAAVGARPVFCDVDAETMNASVATVGEAMDRATKAGLRVRALLPVDLFGRCAPVGALGALADARGLSLIADAAQSIGARDDAGRPSGAAGDAACYSFFPSKNLGAWGDGGAIVTRRDDLAVRARRLRAHGAVQPYVHAELGRNSRLDALQAAVLLAKAPRLPAWQAARARIARRYQSELAGLPLSLPPAPPSPAVHAWHAFVVRTERRDDLAAALRDSQVEARVYYPVPLHRQPCFAALGEAELPVAEAACRTALALPISPGLRDEQQTYVIERIARFFHRT